MVDSWEDTPAIRLVRRNSEGAEDLFSMPLPPALMEAWREANGDLKGVSAPPPKIKAWLKEQLGQ